VELLTSCRAKGCGKEPLDPHGLCRTHWLVLPFSRKAEVLHAYEPNGGTSPFFELAAERAAREAERLTPRLT
jgi:hypothetical protein